MNTLLKPHLAALLWLGNGGHHAIPLTRLENPCLSLCWSQDGTK